jgi:hypothetical protein
MLRRAWKWLTEMSRLAQWVILGIGMVIILWITSWNVPNLTLSNRAFLTIATVLVAGLCVWIINWGDDEDDEDEKK